MQQSFTIEREATELGFFFSLFENTMNTVPQQYYDTCERVDYLLRQAQQHSQLSSRSTEARASTRGAAFYGVHTLPEAPSNVDDLRTRVPARRTLKVAPETSQHRQASTSRTEVRAGRADFRLEERYAQLLQRIAEEVKMNSSS